MRCLGEIEGRKSTETFVAYLLTQGISTHVDRSDGNPGDRWEVWIRDEDQMVEARNLLDQFQSNPLDAKYQGALKEASRILTDRSKQQEMAAKNVRRPQYNLSPLQDRRIPPITLTLVILCSAVSLLSNFGSPGPHNEIGQSIVNQLSFVTKIEYVTSEMDPAVNLKKGQVWRAITPIFLHMNPMHLVFNVLGLVALGRIIERWLGAWKYVLFVLVSAVLSNLLQGLAPEWMRGNPMFGGISGVVYALFGYLWVRTILNPNLGIRIPFPIIMILLVPLVIGFSGMVQNWDMADLAHLGGLVVGVAVAAIQERS